MNRIQLLMTLGISSLLYGCVEPEILSDYDLQINIATPEGANYDEREAKLVHLDALGNVNFVVDLGVVTNGGVSFDEAPALPVGTIGLAIVEAGLGPNEIRKDSIFAWGQAELGGALGTGGDSRVVNLLVSALGRVSKLGELGGDRSIVSGIAATATGQVVVVGGADRNSVVTSDVRISNPIVDGSYELSTVGEYDTPGQAHSYASTVVKNGKELIFVSGGRRTVPTNGGSDGGAGDESRRAALIDPDTGEVIWQSETALPNAVSEHQHLVLENGRVLIFDNMLRRSSSMWRFNPQTNSVKTIGSGLNIGQSSSAGASLGTGGALICGGGDFEESSQSWIPQSGCVSVSLQGDVNEVQPMPEARLGHAMIGLDDGTALVTGGITVEHSIQVNNATSDGAYLYVSNAWTPIPSMNFARAQHSMATTHATDGTSRVLIVGGAASTTILDEAPQEPVTCPELYDPASRTFTSLEPCLDAAGGSFVKTFDVPNVGVLIFRGFFKPSNRFVGADTLAIYPHPPTFADGTYPPSVE